MRKQFTKVMTIVAMAFLANVSALAQGLGGHSHVTVESAKKGADWEIFHFPKVDRKTGQPVKDGDDNFVYYDRHYYDGGYFDDMTVKKFPGDHWKGHTLDDLGSSGQFYLCNVKTGEYLQIGDYWGSNTMTNHAGIPYYLEPATNKRKRDGWKEFNYDETAAGHWLCVKLEGQDDETQKYVGRLHAGDGQQGHYEHNRYLALRHPIEYHEYPEWSNWSQHPGAFVFWFEPVTTSDGKQAYVIYTHRQTSGVYSGNLDRSEFWDRDSYLLLRSEDKTTTGYHTVRWKKFAGQMYGKPGGASWPNTILTYGDDKDNPIEDETEYYNPTTGEGRKYVSFADGIKDVTNAPGAVKPFDDESEACLWKIVTKEERERFRLVASDEKPVDMTYRIKNNKFYTSYTYTRSVGDVGVTWDSDNEHYTHENGERPFGWQWFDVDRETHYTNHHIHPWNQHKVSNPGYFDVDTVDTKRSRELHKIGTGYYHRFNSKYYDDKQQENNLTFGVEANFVGSIWKGTTNLQQTIGLNETPDDPPLREGLYVVAVKAFYAPHDMMKYFDDNGTYKHKNSASVGDTGDDESTLTALGTDNQWYKEAVVTGDTSEGDKNDNGKWRRSHDSYLFAWSHPNGVTTRKATAKDVALGLADAEDEVIDNKEEVRRMLPSIYEGAVNWDELTNEEKKLLSNEYLIKDPNFKYTELGDRGLRNVQVDNFSYADLFNHLKDSLNIAIYNGNHFSASRDDWASSYGSGNWAVPKSLFAAGHWFNTLEAVDDKDENNQLRYPNLQNLKAYRIALPVYVGSDGVLTIGIDHTRVNAPVTFDYEYVDDEGNTQPASRTIPKSNPDEWVCFDDFELIYLGKVEPDEFVIDERHGSALNMVESRMLIDGNTGEPYTSGENVGKWSNDGNPVVNKNNTQWKDLFDDTDIVLNGLDARVVKTVVIRRTMTKEGWNSIVFPVDLTYGQVKKGFGDSVQVSKLAGFTGRIIEYEPVQRYASGENKGKVKEDNEVIIKAGVPYIIRPTIDPVVPANSEEVKYERPVFTKAYSTPADGVAGYVLRDEKRNYEVETKMAGPIYVIDSVEIKTSVTFPEVKMKEWTEQDEDGNDITMKARLKDPYTSAELAAQDSTWTAINAFNDGKLFKINRSDAKGKYKLVETAHYLAGQKIPQYSYFFSGGKMYYTTNPNGVATTRGLFSYLQMVGADSEAEPVYSKPFINGVDEFIEVFDETTGIEDVDKRVDPDGKLEIYDLMGRKVTNPRPGTIYIMNGVKVMWK